MIEIDGESFTIEDVVAVAREHESVMLSAEAKKKIRAARELVEDVISKNETVYGVTTGVGELATEKISQKKVDELQRNLIRSHSCGVGDPLSTEIVRAVMVLRANSLAKGYSGVRVKIVETLLAMLNKGVHPVIPERGSVGSSGDLIPLAHMALSMIGEGQAEYDGETLSSKEALEKAGIEPVSLTAKEGLGLINGTQLMTAIGSLVIYDGERLLKNAQIAGVMSLEALKGTDQAFREEIQHVRRHEAQQECAENLWRLTRDSKIIASHKNCPRVQDAYTLRCMPQVFGASKDALSYARKIFENEINAATDNPLVFPDKGEILSGGNFHGQPLALTLDFLGVSLSEIGSFSERRIARLVDPNLSGLPPFLTEKRGLNSGFMMPQYAAAALTNENKVLCHPASSDTIPTSANKEDHVSMGATAALKLLRILSNVRNIIAIEFLAAAQAVEFHEPLLPGPAIQDAHKKIREKSEKLREDRSLHVDIKQIADLISSGEILAAVEKK